MKKEKGKKKKEGMKKKNEKRRDEEYRQIKPQQRERHAININNVSLVIYSGANSATSSAFQWCLALDGHTTSTGHSSSYATDTPMAERVLPAGCGMSDIVSGKDEQSWKNILRFTP